MCTVKPKFNDHPRDPKIVALLAEAPLYSKCGKQDAINLKGGR